MPGTPGARLLLGQLQRRPDEMWAPFGPPTTQSTQPGHCCDGCHPMGWTCQMAFLRAQNHTPGVFLIQKKKKKLLCPVVSKICTAPTDDTSGVTNGGWNRRRLEGNRRRLETKCYKAKTRFFKFKKKPKKTCPLETPLSHTAAHVQTCAASANACPSGRLKYWAP